MRNLRLDKKLHKKWLNYGVVDAAQVSEWRDRLFNSNENEVFHIDEDNNKGLACDVAQAIVKHRLQYCVSKISSSEADPWLSKGGLVIFKFWAKNHPEIFVNTGNNPEVV